MENKLEVLKKALEMGARIEISFHGNVSLDGAKEKALPIAKGLGMEVVYSASEKEHALFERFKTDDYTSQINVNSYFTSYKAKEETA